MASRRKKRLQPNALKRRRRRNSSIKNSRGIIGSSRSRQDRARHTKQHVPPVTLRGRESQVDLVVAPRASPSSDPSLRRHRPSTRHKLDHHHHHHYYYNHHHHHHHHPSTSTSTSPPLSVVHKRRQALQAASLPTPQPISPCSTFEQISSSHTQSRLRRSGPAPPCLPRQPSRNSTNPRASSLQARKSAAKGSRTLRRHKA